MQNFRPAAAVGRDISVDNAPGRGTVDSYMAQFSAGFGFWFSGYFYPAGDAAD
jgi:hypothetical protein